jgi:hypothetical protein
MSQYKLRLSDGTMLVVDHVSLRTWTADDGAMVQAAGARGWRSLKEVLAQESRIESNPLATIPFKALDDGPRREPPPSTRELAVLSFASGADDDSEDEDIYEEPNVGWIWVKRVVTAAVLVGAVGYVAVTWQTWWPKTVESSAQLFGEIERRAQPPAPATPNPVEQQSRQLREAVQAATQQLPHLPAETIELVMSSSLEGVLDPPEVFRRAYDAAERGTAALPAGEAQELRALKRTIVSALDPAERLRLQEYDIARVRAATLPFEDREALKLLVRAAGGLPETSRERYRTLSGKAVAVALDTEVN